jgi:tRNA modification GTPase
MADPGDAFLRAFLNGKTDLSQAEAVADLISPIMKLSPNCHAANARWSNEIAKLREELLNFASLIELRLRRRRRRICR